jgi:hypothetical protein
MRGSTRDIVGTANRQSALHREDYRSHFQESSRTLINPRMYQHYDAVVVVAPRRPDIFIHLTSACIELRNITKRR